MCECVLKLVNPLYACTRVIVVLSSLKVLSSNLAAKAEG